MKFALILIIQLALYPFQASALDEQKLLQAIERAEGGKKARSPYGVLGVRVRDKAHAREVALRTIRSALRDWDGRGDPIVAIGRRYCPPSVDPVGHRNWVSNVRRIMRSQP